MCSVQKCSSFLHDFPLDQWVFRSVVFKKCLGISLFFVSHVVDFQFHVVVVEVHPLAHYSKFKIVDTFYWFNV